MSEPTAIEPDVECPNGCGDPAKLGSVFCRLCNGTGWAPADIVADHLRKKAAKPITIEFLPRRFGRSHASR